MNPLPENGLIHLNSPYLVPETVQRFEAILLAKNPTIFAGIDHSGEAAKVGLTMRPDSAHHFRKPEIRLIRDGRLSYQRRRPAAEGAGVEKRRRKNFGSPTMIPSIQNAAMTFQTMF
jgi:hypothetical protein